MVKAQSHRGQETALYQTEASPKVAAMCTEEVSMNVKYRKEARNHLTHSSYFAKEEIETQRSRCLSFSLMQIDGETMKTATDFIFLGSKITADGDCSHEIKRHLLLGRKAMTNLDSMLKNRDITLPTKVHLIKAGLFRQSYMVVRLGL